MTQTTPLLSRAEINAMLTDMERFPNQYDDLFVMTALCQMALAYIDKSDEGNRMLTAIGEMADA